LVDCEERHFLSFCYNALFTCVCVWISIDYVYLFTAAGVLSQLLAYFLIEFVKLKGRHSL
jgi:hypothetical protein